MAVTSRSSFLDDLPSELRIEIYRRLFSHCPWLSLHVYDSNVFDARSNAQAPTVRPTVASLMSTCRVVHAEAIRELLDLSEASITINGLPEDARNMKTLGSVESITFWKSLRKVELTVDMRPERERGFSAAKLLERMRKVVQVLENGRYLLEIHVRLDWPEWTSFPACAQDVITGLRELHVGVSMGGKAKVRVTMVGEMDDDEKAAEEDRLRDHILSAASVA